MTPNTTSKAHIVATIGPASANAELISKMIEHGMDGARLNFSWGTLEEHADQITMIRKAEEISGRSIPIIQDIPGPRIQTGKVHDYDKTVIGAVTEKDKSLIAFGVQQKLEYVAVSFVGSVSDVETARAVVREHDGAQKIIAKIERAAALECLDEIINAADGIMVARGDLGSEVPIERIPFIQANIIARCKKAGKPVIVATEMLLSMKSNPVPTRAEVTDVANAILQGSDAVMLSEETTIGKYPLETVMIMERIIAEAEKNLGDKLQINPL